MVKKEQEKIDYERLNTEQAFSEKDPFTEERYRQFFRHFPSGARSVLDAGCNTGRGGAVLKSLGRGLHLVGLDCVKSRLERLPREVYDDFIFGFSTAIDAPDSTFDVVCAGEFIEHLEMSDVHRSLGEFHRTLRPGGVLLLTTPNPDYIRLKLTGRSVLGGAHLSQHRVVDLTRMLREGGFSNISVKGSGKVSRFLGENFPILLFYGSYLVSAEKTRL